MAYLMNVYRAFMRVEMSVKAQYRANLALWMVGALVEPVVYLIVWMNVANAQGGEIGGAAAHEQARHAPAQAALGQRLGTADLLTHLDCGRVSVGALVGNGRRAQLRSARPGRWPRIRIRGR